jgi:hypothetical protein
MQIDASLERSAVMRKQEPAKKLVLRRETLEVLTKEDLLALAAGGISDVSNCGSPSIHTVPFCHGS